MAGELNQTRSEEEGGRRGLTLRLEVSVDEPHEVEVLESGDDFCSVELGVLLGQTLAWSGLQRSEELPTHAVLHT